MSTESKAFPPIAIIGIGLRLPGGISTTEGLWNLLANKESARVRVPSDRFNIDAFHKKGHQNRGISSEYGYFLDLNLKSFDSSFFHLPRDEASSMDPQQRLLLQVVWECMENAGQTNWQGANIGCYVGSFGDDWNTRMMTDLQTWENHHASGFLDYALSSRISYTYNLQGPSLTIRTACSSTLFSLDVACQALQQGRCDAAIVAGTNLIMHPIQSLKMSRDNLLSPEGICKSFDTEASGFCRGEAVNAILIKPLQTAIDDGDPIRAVIRSVAVNSNGKTPGMFSPSAKGQEAVMKKAYAIAGISDVCQTAYVECHGTGTRVGDREETTAIANIFGERGVFIASHKPNLGHSEGASGLTAIIKAVLSLEHQAIPPNIHFRTPNPEIPFKSGRLQVPLELTAWPENRCARVSVNSTGFGGDNAHAIVESASAMAPAHGQPKVTGDPCNYAQEDSVNSFRKTHRSSEPESTRYRLIPVSAHNKEALQRRLEAVMTYMKCHQTLVDDLAYTLSTKREHLAVRTFLIVQSSGEISESPELPITCGPRPHMIFIFTGQGAHWFGMGRELVHNSVSFLEDIRTMDKTLQGLTESPSWTLEGLLTCEEDEELLNHADVIQPLCTALQIGLVNLLSHWGITPNAVVGHSSGEIAAAYGAGALTMAQAVSCAYYRGKSVQEGTPEGTMAAIGLGKVHVKPLLRDGVDIACENSPDNIVISGDEKSVEDSIEAISHRHPSVFVRRLPANKAYHSNHMAEAASAYERLSSSIDFISPPQRRLVEFYSSSTGQRIGEDHSFGPDYWRTNLEAPVLFHQAVQAMLDDHGDRTLLVEIGPHKALGGHVKRLIRHRKNGNAACVYVPTLHRQSDCYVDLLKAVGRIHSQGFHVNFLAVNPKASILTDMAGYPWGNSAELLATNRLDQSYRERRYPHHELLGSSCVEINELQLSWRNVLRCSELPWLDCHKVTNEVVMPMAGYIAMAGQAVMQAHDCETYTLRNLRIESPLNVPSDEEFEMMTTMQARRLRDGVVSVWSDISIMSRVGSTWTLNCIAQGKPDHDIAASEQKFERHPRRVKHEQWIRRLKKLGLTTGPELQRLYNITADPNETKASAELPPYSRAEGAHYLLHPAQLDACIQLVAIAAFKGVTRRINELHLPISLQFLSVKPGVTSLRIQAKTGLFEMSEAQGDVTGISESNETMMEMNGVSFTPLSRNRHVSTAPAMSLRWFPDIDLVDLKTLIRGNKSEMKEEIMVQRLTALGILRLCLDVPQSPPALEHLVKYLQWARKQKQEMLDGNWNLLIPEAQQWAVMQWSELDPIWQAVCASTRSMGDTFTRRSADALQKLFEYGVFQDIWNGKSDPLQFLMSGEVLETWYPKGQANYDQSKFFSLLGHSKPEMRVLEVGAGTGSMTKTVLSGLTTDEGIQLFSQYVFTDISSSFLSKARDTFKEYDGVLYQHFDITKDPVEQNLELGTYDLIIASNVLHLTSPLPNVLQNMRQLLSPGGRLYLQEITAPVHWRFFTVFTGLLADWWRFDFGCYSSCGPFIDPGRWDSELRAAGFSGLDCFVYEDEVGQGPSALMVSTALEQGSSKQAKRIVLVYNKEKHSFAQALSIGLERNGYEVYWNRVGCIDHDVDRSLFAIFTLDLEGPFLYDMTESDYKSLISSLKHFQSSMLWLTKSAQVRCTDPRFGMTTGFVRVLRNEWMLDISSLELHSFGNEAMEASLAMLQKLQNRQLDSKSGKDWEFAFYDDEILISRYSEAVEPIRNVTASDISNEAYCAIAEKVGMLDSIRWTRVDCQAPQSNEVEIEPKYQAINFRDIAVATGLIDSTHPDKMGFEGVGIVKRIGLAVSRVKPGDRVSFMWPGALATRSIVPEIMVYPLPDEMSLEDASGICVPALTATVALEDIGSLSAGQSVLIHSACGATGLMAIQICKYIGAEIFATVSNEEKIKYLIDTYDIPRGHIFSSRSTAFSRQLLRVTHGRGVDLVLNYLGGDLLHASWDCVAPYGIMVELGKQDIAGHGQLALRPFLENRAFHCLDLFSLLRDKPELLLGWMARIFRYYQEGSIQPIKPRRIFDADDVAPAYRYMTGRQHIGRNIIRIPEISEAQKMAKSAVDAGITLRADRNYLLTGALRGLGRAIASWMVECGARSITFLSRSAGKLDEDHEFLQELEAQGCSAIAVAGSVTDPADVKRAVDAAGIPVAGVIHLAMVVKDGPLDDMSFSDWQMPVDPKVIGALNLHQALAQSKLDFFILASSISSVMGRIHQANYASANSFLDTLTLYRQTLGLPSSTVSLGPFRDLGYMLKKTHLVQFEVRIGRMFHDEKDLIDAVKRCMRCSKSRGAQISPGMPGVVFNPAHLVTGLEIITQDNTHAEQQRDSRLALMFARLPSGRKHHDFCGSQIQEDRLFLGMDADTPMDIIQDLVSAEVKQQMAWLFTIPTEEISDQSDLRKMGLDSLVAIDIHERWSKTFEVEPSVYALLRCYTVNDLTSLTVELGAKKWFKRDQGTNQQE